MLNSGVRGVQLQSVTAKQYFARRLCLEPRIEFFLYEQSQKFVEDRGPNLRHGGKLGIPESPLASGARKSAELRALTHLFAFGLYWLFSSWFI